MRIFGFGSIFIASLAAFGAASAMAQTDYEILTSFAEDYAGDVTLDKKRYFGVEVGVDAYTIEVAPKSDAQPAFWSVTRGAPETPTYYFTLESSDYLRKLDRGEFNALTLMAKAFSSDKTPMDMETQEGFQPGEGFLGEILSTAFHFWNRGKPEIVKFSADATRFVHGANAGVFYYQPGFRSAWFSINPGDHVNEDINSRTNPFPSLFILIEGTVTARIDGVDGLFSAGEAMLVPAGVTHEFLNQGDAPAMGFLLMFGEGA